MFESALIATLRSDVTLAALVDTYRSAPAIFTGAAPEQMGPDARYIIVTIDQNSPPDTTIDNFTINLDYYAHGTSWADARAAAFRVIELLDRIHLDHERYGAVRLFRDGATPIHDPSDPLEIHYNSRVYARGGRKLA